MRARGLFHAASAIAAAVALAFALSGCGGGQLEQAIDRVADDPGYILVDSLNVSGDAIGKRAVAPASKEDFKKMSHGEFEAFVEETVLPAGETGADYLTVDFGDGTGLTFPSCSGDLVFYGKLDEEGMMAGKCETYRYSKKTWVRDRER